MPYDPPYAPANPWWQQQQRPQQGQVFAQPPPPTQPKQWYEGLPTVKPGQFANSPDDANSAKQPQPSLMQMLMLGGKPTMSGAPSGSYGAIPSQGANMGSMNPWRSWR